MPRKSLREQRGFTLVEIIIVVLLVTLLILTAYAIFDVGLLSYRVTNTEVKAQENFRLVTDYLDLELKNAAYARLLASGDPQIGQDIVTDGAILLYVKNFEGIQNALYEKKKSGETMIGYPVEDLIITYGSSTGEYVDVYMTTKDVKQFTTRVLLENTILDTISGAGIAILFQQYPDT